MLDYQKKLKSKATDFAIEGIIMFKDNKTAEWRVKFLEIVGKRKIIGNKTTNNYAKSKSHLHGKNREMPYKHLYETYQIKQRNQAKI